MGGQADCDCQAGGGQADCDCQVGGGQAESDRLGVVRLTLTGCGWSDCGCGWSD